MSRIGGGRKVSEPKKKKLPKWVDQAAGAVADPGGRYKKGSNPLKTAKTVKKTVSKPAVKKEVKSKKKESMFKNNPLYSGNVASGLNLNTVSKRDKKKVKSVLGL